MQRKVIITADDFGISTEINSGILIAHRNGLLSSVSLMVNGEASLEALQIASENPALEIGLHLGIVEGFSLRGVESSITDKLRYFNGSVCLHRHWKQFLLRYMIGKINFSELEEEFELQIQEFLRHYQSIPFMNSTQHLHLLPKVSSIIIKLAKKYKIKFIRVPHNSMDLPKSFESRWIYSRIIFTLGKFFKKTAEENGIATTDHFLGFDVSGQLDEGWLLAKISNLSQGVTEIMTHPGLECNRLRAGLPWGYANFSWQSELDALLSKRLISKLRARDFDQARFSDISDNKI